MDVRKLSKAMSTDVSPDSKCPICLDIFQNTSIVDLCMHKFCFRCILQWSKNKAECPLCKRTFNSIYHSIRSEWDFKTLDVKNLLCGTKFHDDMNYVEFDPTPLDILIWESLMYSEPSRALENPYILCSDSDVEEEETEQEASSISQTDVIQDEYPPEEYLFSDSDYCVIVNFTQPAPNQTHELVRLSSDSDEPATEDVPQETLLLSQYIPFSSLSPAASHSSNLCGTGASEDIETKRDSRHSRSRTYSSNHSPSVRRESHHDKPGGKRKYKTRHLEESSQNEDSDSGATIHKKINKEKRHKRFKESSRMTSRSLSVEVVIEEEAPEQSRRHHKKKHKKRESKNHQDKLSPEVITIDSDSIWQ